MLLRLLLVLTFSPANSTLWIHYSKLSHCSVLSQHPCFCSADRSQRVLSAPAQPCVGGMWAASQRQHHSDPPDDHRCAAATSSPKPGGDRLVLSTWSTRSPRHCRHVWSWAYKQVMAWWCAARGWGGMALLGLVWLQFIVPVSAKSGLGMDRISWGAPWVILELLQIWKIQMQKAKLKSLSIHKTKCQPDLVPKSLLIPFPWLA